MTYRDAYTANFRKAVHLATTKVFDERIIGVVYENPDVAISYDWFVRGPLDDWPYGTVVDDVSQSLYFENSGLLDPANFYSPNWPFRAIIAYEAATSVPAGLGFYAESGLTYTIFNVSFVPFTGYVVTPGGWVVAGDFAVRIEANTYGAFMTVATGLSFDLFTGAATYTVLDLIDMDPIVSTNVQIVIEPSVTPGTDTYTLNSYGSTYGTYDLPHVDAPLLSVYTDRHGEDGGLFGFWAGGAY